MTSSRWTWIWTRARRFRPWVLVVLVLAAVIAAGAQAQLVKLRDYYPPAGHPIYDPYLSLRRPEDVRIGRLHNEVVRAARVEPEFRLRLSKRRYAIGEPIWATLTARNPSDKHAVRLSPPYVGQHVATAGVWRARWDWLRGGQFTGPLEVVPLNKGRSPSPPGAACYGGAPIVLAPGETYTATVPLNVAQQVEPSLWQHGGPGLAWFGGVGLTEPGLYRLYVQYANLEVLVPFGTDLNEAAMPELRGGGGAGEPADLPFEAIVPEPVEVEIVAPRMDAWDPLQQQADLSRYVDLLRAWEPAVLNTKDDMVGLPRLEALAAVLDSLHESEAAVRQSLMLTKLRFEFSRIDPGDSHYPGKVKNVLAEAQEARREVEPGPMAASYDLTICHLLRSLGREAEATELAQTLDTPDAAVFLKQVNGTDDR